MHPLTWLLIISKKWFIPSPNCVNAISSAIAVEFQKNHYLASTKTTASFFRSVAISSCVYFQHLFSISIHFGFTYKQKKIIGIVVSNVPFLPSWWMDGGSSVNISDAGNVKKPTFVKKYVWHFVTKACHLAIKVSIRKENVFTFVHLHKTYKGNFDKIGSCWERIGCESFLLSTCQKMKRRRKKNLLFAGLKQCFGMYDGIFY